MYEYKTQDYSPTESAALVTLPWGSNTTFYHGGVYSPRRGDKSMSSLNMLGKRCGGYRGKVDNQYEKAGTI